MKDNSKLSIKNQDTIFSFKFYAKIEDCFNGSQSKTN